VTTPLEGIRVIEVANYVAGPAVGALMRDLGADVIKVEPPGGEVSRATTSAATMVDGRAGFNNYFTLENRGKRSVTVALDRPGGPELVHRLLAKADVLLTNLILPRLEKYGLTPEEVHARNPHIVYVSVTGYGIRGPEAWRPGFDFAAFWARSGIMGVSGHPDAPPVISRVAQGDHTTGINGLAATLAALRLRDLTGKGQVVEVSLQQTGAYTISTDLSRVLVDGRQPARFNREEPANPLFNTYETRDGSWLMIVHMTPDRYWPKLCAALGAPEWAENPAHATMKGRRDDGPALYRAIQDRILEHDYEHWRTALDANGLIWAPMVELPAVVNDAQLRTMGAFQEVPGEEYETVGTPFVIRDADVRVRGRSPEAGEHTLAVLEELGLDAEQIAELAVAGVIG
jgi:crotonobetainyl-CoA:carnitine CoA-transferase CaiB-like acyl-CoA transferase